MRCILVGLSLLAAHPCAAETVQVLNPPFIPQMITAASLPTCNAASTGVVYQVTDSLLPALGIVVAGGGAVSVLVRCNGTSWLVGQ